MGSLEGRIYGHNTHADVERDDPTVGSLVDMVTFYRIKARVLDLGNNINSIERRLKSIANESYRILKVSNERVKILINKLEGIPREEAIIIISGDQGATTDIKEGSKRRTK